MKTRHLRAHTSTSSSEMQTLLAKLSMAWPLVINKFLKYLKMSARNILPWNFGSYSFRSPHRSTIQSAYMVRCAGTYISLCLEMGIYYKYYSALKPLKYLCPIYICYIYLSQEFVPSYGHTIGPARKICSNHKKIPVNVNPPQQKH